ncbi:MAG: hypothetical protein LBG75_01850 [Candidatus Nomurabacteria bacterium]|jgi:hypothetical protein|nr:hypothetical protein [Candidatus Nomurabacteria bacterium]
MGKTVKFDISAWRQPLKHQDFRVFYKAESTPFFKRQGVLVFLGLIIAPLAIGTLDLFVLPWLMNGSSMPQIVHLWFLAVTVFAVAASLCFMRISRREVRLAKFCRVNELAYRSKVRDLRIDGAPFLNNHTSLTAPLVSGVFDGEKFTLGRYSVINEDRESNVQVRRPFTFALSSLPRSVPHIILKNRRSRIIPLIGATSANAKLTLEGDYSDKFTLICPKNYEQDALRIFTPDVIAAVYDFAPDAEIELVDNRLFIYTRDGKALRYPEKMMQLFGLLARLDSYFDRQAERYRDDFAKPGSNVATTAQRLNLNNISILTLLWSVPVFTLVAFQFLRLLGVQPFTDWFNFLVKHLFGG